MVKTNVNEKLKPKEQAIFIKVAEFDGLRNDEESTWARLKHIAAVTGLESTAHGIPKIVGSKMWPLKIIWTVCFLTSCGFCGFLLYRSVNDYLAYDVVTTIKKIRETPTIFPTVTLCNSNLISRRAAYDYFRAKMQADPVLFASTAGLYESLG